MFFLGCFFSMFFFPKLVGSMEMSYFLMVLEIWDVFLGSFGLSKSWYQLGFCHHLGSQWVALIYGC